MSSSDSTNPSADHADDIDPAIAGAVDVVGNRFGAQGLEQLIGYAEQALAKARAALEELAQAVD